MKLQVSGGGAGEFIVRDESGAELRVSSQESGYQAVHAVAEWLNAKAAPELARSAKSKFPPPKGDE